jgi:hypothetical protein
MADPPLNTSIHSPRPQPYQLSFSNTPHIRHSVRKDLSPNSFWVVECKRPIHRFSSSHLLEISVTQNRKRQRHWKVCFLGSGGLKVL